MREVPWRREDAAALDPKPHEERAREIALGLLGMDASSVLGEAGKHQIGHLAAALAAERAKALEEAARIADGFTCRVCGMDGRVAAALRAASELLP